MATTQRDANKRVCVCGGAGFIGSHLARQLKSRGCYVVVVDRLDNPFWKGEEELYYDEFLLLDLRLIKNCVKATQGCDEVYNLAADMGGMGYIQSNESVILFNNTLISANVLEAARRNGVRRYFYSGSACCYNEKKQLDVNNPGLVESDAWPAWPQDTYGLEKLYAEEMGMIYGRDFDMDVRIARFHNIYGPKGTWKGGREKAPAAFCRKAAAITPGNEITIWGDGHQTRSFCYVDDCVEGILRLMESDYDKPVNIGSEEMVSINQLAELALSFDGKKCPLKHIPGPEGVRGRNSDNTLIRRVLNWEPQTRLEDGLRRTYEWIKEEMSKLQAAGDTTDFTVSTVVQQSDSALESGFPDWAI